MTNETMTFLQAGDAAGAAIARDADRAVNELARMVAVDTSFPPGRGYATFADLMEELTRPLGFDHRRVEVRPGSTRAQWPWSRRAYDARRHRGPGAQCACISRG
jgi:hypothetical protein